MEKLRLKKENNAKKMRLKIDREVTIKDLKDQILTSDKSLLYCFGCGVEFSANKGDYWNIPENHIFTHCGENMQLVTKKTVYERV